MNFKDVVDTETGLHQDEWSLSRPTFGKHGQIEVIGWSGRDGNSNKFYIVKCSDCSKDVTLHGDGIFKITKGNLTIGSVPCGCSNKPKWSRDQFIILCSRESEKLGHTFIGFTGEWCGALTKIVVDCKRHGIWATSNITNYINSGHGCPDCGIDNQIKPNAVMIESFFSAGTFHPNTIFQKIGRRPESTKTYWLVSCPECGEVGESTGSNLQLGHRPCACSPMRQRECYINLLLDDYNNTIAIKFGIANNSKQRIKNQVRHATYTIKQHSVYTFPDVASCRKAERECKKELECGVVLKRDMPDGWTETTWVHNFDKIKSIYERNGGTLND